MAESLNITTPAVFTLSPGVTDQFSFAMVGDLHLGGGNTTRLRRILADATAEGDEFVLFLGDIVDHGTQSDVQAFHQAIADTGWTGKTFSVAGNHDVFGDGWGYFRDLTGSSTYAFTAGNAKFIALDSADATLGSRQTQWLRTQLAGPNPAHVFVFSHYSPVVPGQETYLKFSSETEALNLMSLCTQAGVRAWLGAHYHSYIKQSIAGVDYLIAGGGGGRKMDPVKDYFFVQAQINRGEVSYQLRVIP